MVMPTITLLFRTTLTRTITLYEFSIFITTCNELYCPSVLLFYKIERFFLLFLEILSTDEIDQDVFNEGKCTCGKNTKDPNKVSCVASKCTDFL